MAKERLHFRQGSQMKLFEVFSIDFLKNGSQLRLFPFVPSGH